ncbi:Integrase catalytic domain-containing protein [Mycena venus]|uniref:Integrase catalytic domain-containing protein n=1 Tax=Mycena venus TaxID=2733690 RepID=A0A8H6Y0S3_9AGAR|nr:Integrase catalytic domain-containing protein [Mycena venus]
MVHPANFPALPETPDDFNWNPDVLRAHDILATAYDRAAILLRQEEADPMRLRIHSEQIGQRLLPILEALVPELGDEAWINSAATAFGQIFVELERSAAVADGIENSKVKRVVPIHVERTGRRGRPKKVVDPVWLADAFSERRKMTLQTIADALGMHRHTLRNYLKLYNVYKRYTEISDQDLDILAKRFKRDKPNSGLRYLIGFLRTHRVKVGRERVRQSLLRVDGLGRILRKHKIERREYESARPNSTWHIDGYHKLIKWGIVIHGIADGFDRMVFSITPNGPQDDPNILIIQAIGLRASTNNRASTVLDLFLRAVQEYGAPSRGRGDRGGENIEVSVWMIKYRGPNRGSFLWGTSTRNTRVERLWVEVGSQFARPWRGFFLRLERLHGLDRDNPHHLWLLHYLFLDDINKDCDDFRDYWNHHPISGKGHDQTPADMRLIGEVKYGKYADNFEDIHPDILDRYGDEDDIDIAIAEDQRHNVRHEPIDVPKHESPFKSEEAAEIFSAALADVKAAEIIPQHLGVSPAEWEEGGYPETEMVKAGRKDVEITLPFPVWWPRAVAWAQGLELLSKIQAVENGDIVLP